MMSANTFTRYQMNHDASAKFAEAAFSCADSARSNSITLILDAMIMASIIIALIGLSSLILVLVLVLVLVSLVLAVLLILGKGNSCKRRFTA